MKIRHEIPAIVAALLLGAPLAWSGPVGEAETGCRREDGSLARYVLCRELQLRYPAETHARYYAELEELQTRVLVDLPAGKAKRRHNLLTSLYHASRPDTTYRARLTLAEALDDRRHGERREFAADCDVFCLLNAGIGEVYYGDLPSTPRVHVVRTRHDHVVNAFTRGSNLVGVLDTQDGSIHAGDSRSLSRYDYFRPMSEDEIVSMHLANTALALAGEGRVEAAWAAFDQALRHNADEFVAHAGRALTLLQVVAAGESDRDGQWCAGERTRGALERAERSLERAMQLEPRADVAWSMMGKVQLHLCRPDHARHFLERAVAARPDPLDLYYLGLIMDQRQEFDAAIRLAHRGRRLIRRSDDPRYLPLKVETEFLLAHAYTRRAEFDGSVKDLRRAMRFLESVQRELSGGEGLIALEQAIRGLDYRIGPARRQFGLSGRLRALYNASLDD